MAEKKNAKSSVVFTGKTVMRNTYTITVIVDEGTIKEIKILGKPNLMVAETCQAFALKHPKNITDVLSVIKLEMIRHNEFVSEIRNG